MLDGYYGLENSRTGELLESPPVAKTYKLVDHALAFEAQVSMYPPYTHIEACATPHHPVEHLPEHPQERLLSIALSLSRVSVMMCLDVTAPGV